MGEGDTGPRGNYQEQHPGAALPAPSLPRPCQCSAEVCGDDGNMEVEEMETSQQQHLILMIQVIVQCGQQEEV